MTDNEEIERLKAEIATTSVSLEQKARALEVNIRDAAGSIKDTVEQGTQGIRKVANAISPGHYVQEHPALFMGALLGLGVYLGARSSRPSRSSQKTSQISLSSSALPSTASPAESIVEPIALGLFAAVAGEVLKKYVPVIAPQATAIQSAVVSEMTQRVVRKFS